MRLLTVLALILWPALAGAQVDVAPRDGRHALGMNLAEVVHYGSQLPFIDVMRSGARWTGHLPGQWGGLDETALREAGALDEDGWVIAVPRGATKVSTFVLFDIPAGMTSTAGRWHARWEGSAYLGFSGGVRDVRYGENSASFEYLPGQGAVTIEFRRGSLRNLSVVHERHLAAFEAGAVFNPDWLARIGDMEILRFMDWTRTNNSTVERWEQRAQVGDYTWERRGVPLEILIRLANETAAEPWFTLPHLADDEYVRQHARMVRDSLRPDLRAWYELSNEIWNWSFQQANWAEQQARARWNRDWAWVQYGAIRAAEAMRVVDAVYADAPERRVRVLGLFTGWLGLEADMLEAPDYRAEDPAHRPPHEAFDALAVTGYFSGELHNESRQEMIRGWLAESLAAARSEGVAMGLSGAALDRHVSDHRFDRAIALAGAELLDGSVSGNPENSVRDLLDRTLAHHARVAADYGKALVMYEGGTHVAASPADHGNAELIAFFEALNYSAEMGDLYRALIAGWQALTPAPFVAYMDVGRPSPWGAWGHLRHLDDDNPRWRALIEATAP